MQKSTIRIIGVCLGIALISSMAVTPATAQSNEERFLVELDPTGDAEFSMTFVYDLNSDGERAAFEELRTNTTERTEISDRFENRMTAVAEDASTATDREMSVSGVGIELERNDNAGLVTLSLQWANLAAVGDDRLTVTEPFASGFEPGMTFIIVAPEEYDILSATPEPASTEERSVTWERNTTLEDFEAVVEASAGGSEGEGTTDSASDETPEEGTTEDSPGFGIVTALLALLAVAVLAVRERKR
jgi:PGF-CTERM protein